MKLLVAFGLVIAIGGGAAAADSPRETAIKECTAQARTMGFTPTTVKWINFVKDCMIDRDVNS